MRLDVQEPVNVIVRTWPGASHVLRRHGLDDFLGWGGTPLEQACKAHGIDLELISGEILRQVDPDVAHAFRASPRAQRPVARPAVTAEPEPIEAPPPAPAPVDDGIPDVASVFRVRAGSPDEPFLHARRPVVAAPQEEPAPAEEEVAEEPTPAPAPDELHPDTQALLARREELRQQLELLVALREEALGQLTGRRPASAPEAEDEEEAVEAELVRLPEPEPEPEPVPLPEPEPALVDDAPSVPAEAPAQTPAAAELPPGEDGSLLSRMRSWFAA